MTIFKNFIASIITNVQGNSDFKNLVIQLNNMGGFRQAVFAGFGTEQYRDFCVGLTSKGVERTITEDEQEVISGVFLKVAHTTLRQNDNILGFLAYIADFKMMFTMMLKNPVPDTLCFLESFYDPISASQNSAKFPLWLSKQAQFVRGSANSIEMLAQQGKESFEALFKKLQVLGGIEVPVTNVPMIHQEAGKLFQRPVSWFHITEINENNLVVDERGYINSKLELQHLFALALYENTMELAGMVSWHNNGGSSALMVVAEAKTPVKKTMTNDEKILDFAKEVLRNTPSPQA